MSYVEKNLLPNEQVTYRAKLHWIIFTTPVLVLVAAIVLAVVGAPWFVSAVIAAVGILAFIPPWLRSVSSEFAVTNKRVLIKVGLISRHSLELLLRQVEGIGVDQTLSGRILGYGTISVVGTGGTNEAFRMISNPLEFRRQVQGSIVAEHP
jgi:uncharacterized membrane protein YdbT with pleckstrin-like domain